MAKKNVLIISMDFIEPSTDMVADWIKHLGHNFTRFNGDTLESLEINTLISSKNNLDLTIENKRVKKRYHSIWYRRWSNLKSHKAIVNLCSNYLDSVLSHAINNNISYNAYSVEQAIKKMFITKKWLTNSSQTSVFKINVLMLAKKKGLLIPEFILTTRKTHLVEFYKEKNEKIIVKDLDSPFHYTSNKNNYLTYTELVTAKTLNTLPESFHLSFFQEYIEKEYEVRTFFLKDKLYSMAIFSQADKATTVDFRKSNYMKPNRTVPYRLPKQTEKKLRILMKELNLETGSIDIIKSPNDNYYFLEVNPIGQFGMVSEPCNYNLELEIAHYLIS